MNHLTLNNGNVTSSTSTGYQVHNETEKVHSPKMKKERTVPRYVVYEKSKFKLFHNAHPSLTHYQTKYYSNNSPQQIIRI
jgi:hypothetical protein